MYNTVVSSARTRPAQTKCTPTTLLLLHLRSSPLSFLSSRPASYTHKKKKGKESDSVSKNSRSRSGAVPNSRIFIRDNKDRLSNRDGRKKELHSERELKIPEENVVLDYFKINIYLYIYMYNILYITWEMCVNPFKNIYNNVCSESVEREEKKKKG